jgi:serine/threonine protein kinase/tetratricopeptide (TPR) repeat protein
MDTGIYTDHEILWGQAANEEFEAVARGETPSIDDYSRRYPEIAEEIACVLPALAAVGVSRPGASPFLFPLSEDVRPQLTDYRILRELGRGGMGIVYEAQQISLGRRVALKILPSAATLDEKALVRFKNEARAAASLDYPNIVPIHAVGAERGVYFYVMSLIEGRTLAEVIGSFRRQAIGKLPQPDDGRRENRVSAASVEAQHPGNSRTGQRQTGLSSRETTREALAANSTMPAFDSHGYWRSVSRLGVQAARALHHAHERGIVHRDIKPANLLVDDAHKLWVTDFGLARIESDVGLTMTGDILGTLRYMSPEQALGKHVLVDHRTDIYSLGATLYELLTLEPVFDGEDRQTLLRQLSFDEPKAPRKINPRIPAELETIVSKAICKDPAERYSSAKDLADDLSSFIEQRPIQAKSPTWREQAVKWSRRHPSTARAVLLATIAVAIVTGVSIGWIARDRATRQALLHQQIKQAVEETEACYQSGKLVEALAAIGRADELIVSDSLIDEFVQRARQWRIDLETVKRLERIRLDQSLPYIARKVDMSDQTNVAVAMERGFSLMFSSAWDIVGADRAYRDEFQRYGLDLNAIDVETTARQIGGSPIRRELVAALDNWYQVRVQLQGPATRGLSQEQLLPGTIELLQIARLADPDPWRNRLRDAIERADLVGVKQLARETNVSLQAPEAGLLLARALMRANGNLTSQEAEAVLRELQRRYPGDFWINTELANCLPGNKLAEEIGFRRIAVALRPGSPGALSALGQRLFDQSAYAESEAAYLEAIRQMPDYPNAHCGLGQALSKQGKHAEAEVAMREAIRLEPWNTNFHSVLCQELIEQERFAACEAVALEAIRAEPNSVIPRGFLGYALAKRAEATADTAQSQQAAAEFAKTYELCQDNLSTQWGRLLICRMAARWDQVFDRVVQLLPEETELRLGRAEVRALDSRWAEAAADYAIGIQARPVSIQAAEYAYLLVLLNDEGRYGECCRQLIDRLSDVERFRNELWYKNDAQGIVAFACAATSNTIVEPAQLVEWATMDVKACRDASTLHGLGLAYYRAGRHELAIQNLEESNALGWRNSGKCQNWLVLAMAHHQLGHEGEAHLCWSMALRGIPELIGNKARLEGFIPYSANRVSPRDWICVNVLGREAAALLSQRLPSELEQADPTIDQADPHTQARRPEFGLQPAHL